jgi:hypothetical protein
MTIRIKKDRIEFDGYTLFETSEGFFFSGQITGCQIQNEFQGTTTGFISGGYTGAALSAIRSFPFATHTNIATLCNLTVAKSGIAGSSSSINGYTSGGWLPGASNVIEKFPFSTNSCSLNIGTICTSRGFPGGHSSYTHGYNSGGTTTGSSATSVNCIEKFPFATDGASINVGGLSGSAGYSQSGTNSSSNGYALGRFRSGILACIDKFPFSTDTNATNIGALSTAVSAATSTAVSSYNNAYMLGGAINGSGGYTSCIQRVSFSTDGNSTGVGNLHRGVANGINGVSNIIRGYTVGGNFPSVPGYVSDISMFPYANESCTVCVGTLGLTTSNSASHQN